MTTKTISNQAAHIHWRQQLTRRTFTSGMLVAALGGCTTSGASLLSNPGPDMTQLASMYGPIKDEKFPIKAVKLSQVKPVYFRRKVNYETEEKPGTIIVDPQTKFLYLVEGNGKAMRYGIGVGRQGFSWSGRAKVGWKRQWPTWTPPVEMMRREPQLAKYAKGMEPGPQNPLGARALYLVQNGKDTLYRIHGTHEAKSIGKAVSSGCVRLINQDVIDLYGRVKSGATVIVLGSTSRVSQSSSHTHNG